MGEDALIVREWSAEVFHQRVLRLEAQGYVTRLETYRISAETNPDTGEIVCLHSIEMRRPSADPR